MSGYPQVISQVNLQVDLLVSALLPGFCTVVFAVALLNVLFFSQGAQGLLRDSDTGCLLNGETILTTGGLPRVDNFSYTRNGQPWFAWEWMSDVLLGGAHRIAGLSGVALLAGFAIRSHRMGRRSALAFARREPVFHSCRNGAVSSKPPAFTGLPAHMCFPGCSPRCFLRAPNIGGFFMPCPLLPASGPTSTAAFYSAPPSCSFMHSVWIEA